MFSSAQPSPLELVTVGDFDPTSDRSIEYDFIGRVIAGRYTVRAKIGGGGMADVYRATDEELGVDVAIKLLKPRMASDELRARMVQEARAAAQVRHANLVRVFGTGKLDSTAFIVMELLEGPNLEQYLRERHDQRLPWHEAVPMLLPALDALHAIHERGYVHRDIKSGNILVTRSPGQLPSAVVIDLGLVKADRALRDATSPPTTEAGRMLCTPGYTSPEQAAGRPVDRRSDVYSMGVTLYRVLAGRLPFQDARGKPVMVVLAKHIYNEPTALAEAAATARIPPEIAAVVESALCKDPAHRPQTMLELARSLQAATAALGDPRPARRTRRPHELILAAGFGAAVYGLTFPQLVRPPVPATTASAEPAAAPLSEPSEAPGRASQPSDTIPAMAAASPDTLAMTPIVTALAPTFDPPAASAEPPTSDASATTAMSAAQKRRRIDAARRATLKRYTPEIQRCADAAAGSITELVVTLSLDDAGRVSTSGVGAEESPLGRCVDMILRRAPLAAGAPTSFSHVFRLRATIDPL